MNQEFTASQAIAEIEAQSSATPPHPWQSPLLSLASQFMMYTPPSSPPSSRRTPSPYSLSSHISSPSPSPSTPAPFLPDDRPTELADELSAILRRHIPRRGVSLDPLQTDRLYDDLLQLHSRMGRRYQ